MVNKFRVDPYDSGIWNQLELEKFLIENQNQDIYIEIREGPDCQVIKLFDILDIFKFKSVTIETWNFVQEPHPVYQILHSANRDYFFKFANKDKKTYQDCHEWTKEKTFLIVYNRPSWHRIGIASHLLTNHKDKTLLNFRYNPKNPDTRNEFQLTELFVHHPESITTFANCFDQFPMLIEDHDRRQVLSDIGEPVGDSGRTVDSHFPYLDKLYRHILIDIVSEAFVNGQLFHPTEKTIRPMLLKKPFIAMTAQDHLSYLRQMGFKTFNEFWDEDYDGYSTHLRYKKILDLIDNLAKKTKNELNDMYLSMQEILDHNYNLVRDKKFFNQVVKCN